MFTHGRDVRQVAACALYMACRAQTDNKTLLMDFAEILRINVFRIGEVFRDMQKTFHEQEYEVKGFKTVMDVEPIVMRFATKLDFGDATEQVAQDAVKILAGMKRDWMVTGRLPAGLCGACLILAGRMNNFRRTTREVVYVVRASAATIMKRFEEFKRTRNSTLTIEQFRKIGGTFKVTHDPPILWETEQKQKQKKRKRHGDDDGEGEMEEAITAGAEAGRADTESTHVDRPPPPKFRRDAQGFAIPNLPASNHQLQTPPATQRPSPPGGDGDETNVSTEATADAEEAAINRYLSGSVSLPPSPSSAATAATTSTNSPPDPASTSSTSPHTKRGRPHKKQGNRSSTPKPAAAPVIIAPEDILLENELEAEMEHEIAAIKSARTITPSSTGADIFTAHAARAKQTALAARKRASAASSSKRHNATEDADAVDDELVDENEFADDAEIRNCLLTEREIEAKERIWVTFNEDWLRKRQARDLKRQLDEAEGHGKKTVKRRKKSLGDGREGRDGGAGGVGMEASPMSLVEENRAMMEKRKKGFSRHINYEKMKAIYAPEAGESVSRSRSPDVGSAAGAAAGATGVGRGVGGMAAGSPYDATDPNTPVDARQLPQGEKMSVQAMMLKSRIMQGNAFGASTGEAREPGKPEAEAEIVEDVVSEDENDNELGGDDEVLGDQDEDDDDDDEERDEDGDLETAIQHQGWGEEDGDDAY